MRYIAEPPMERAMVPMLQRWGEEERRIVMTTAAVDIIPVGDSVNNMCLGFENALPVSEANMNHHLEAVVRTGPRSLLVADMPFLAVLTSTSSRRSQCRRVPPT